MLKKGVFYLTLLVVVISSLLIPLTGKIKNVEAVAQISGYVRTDGNDSLCDGSADVDYSADVAPACAFKTIQHAIDNVETGGVVFVAAGLYEETITIDKSLTLYGSSKDSIKKGITVPTDYAWDESNETIIQPPSGSPDADVVTIDDANDVTFQGFIVQALERTSSGSRHLIHVYIDDQSMENLKISNNVVGPNTNVNSQNGNKGRMNIDIDLNPYIGEQGLLNSTISGNKVFGNEGNGNALFLWGSYAAYGASQASPMTGTRIENNEICCGHRSGIEIAGGVDGLLIKDNYIHDFSSNSGDDDILKYGNGILMIRGSSDREDCAGYGPVNVQLKNNEIFDNEKHGIYMGPKNNGVSMENNNIHDNGRTGITVDLIGNYWNPDFDSEAGPYTCLDGSDSISINESKITNNTNYGVKVVGDPSNSFVLDAGYNWWNDATGPGEEGNGTGDNVSKYVDYKPWYASGSTSSANKDNYVIKDGENIVAYSDNFESALKVLDNNPTYTLRGNNIAKDTITYSTESGEVVIDDKNNSNLEVTKKGSGTPAVTLVYFSDNPMGEDPGFTTFSDSFVDVHFDNTDNLDEVTVKLWYTEEQVEGLDESSLYLKYWDGSSWVSASDTGVNTTNTDEYSGYVWANISSESTPDLSYLTGQQFAAGGEQESLPALGMNLYMWTFFSLLLLSGGVFGVIRLTKLRYES